MFKLIELELFELVTNFNLFECIEMDFISLKLLDE